MSNRYQFEEEALQFWEKLINNISHDVLTTFCALRRKTQMTHIFVCRDKLFQSYFYFPGDLISINVQTKKFMIHKLSFGTKTI